jgi:RecA/RadA recombinase
MKKKDKLKAVNKAVEAFRKKNEGADVAVGSESFGKIELVNSGIWGLDRLTCGFPRGMYTHIAGLPGAGKSTTALRFIASLQQMDFICALANNERRFSREWAAANGVNMKDLLGGNFKDLEQCLDFAITMAETGGACDCLVVDTITALGSRGEMRDKKGERSTDDNTMAQIPRKLSQFFRMATARISDSGMVVILINQVRKDLSNTMYVKDISVGGNALEHMKTLDIFLRKTARKLWPVNEDEEFIGHGMKATLLKSSHTMSAREGDETVINFFKGRGFDNEYDIAYHARESGLIESARGKYTYVDSDKKEHTVNGKRAGIDLKIRDYLIKNNLVDQVKTRLEETSTDNVGSVEAIEFEDGDDGQGEDN